MLAKYIKEKIEQNLQFVPTAQQSEVLTVIVHFLLDKKIDNLFLMRGYAGTGKTSILGALVKTMLELKQKLVLLAPTGRAAKVLSFHSDYPAFTIHKKIYTQKAYSGNYSEFCLTDNLHKDTTFVVDEASMIHNDSYGDTSFGTGRLLDDLINYVYSGENCRLLLIGDDAQLPPIGLEDSPALSVDVLQGYGLNVFTAQLSEVVRQKNDSGILFNATEIRKALNNHEVHLFPELTFKNFADIKTIQGEDLIDEISSSFSRDGIDSTMIVTRSNKRANIYNQGIRNRILYKEDEISSGDLLIIAKNNYYWSEKIEGIDFLANGEIVEVKRVRGYQELYNLRFCDVEVKGLDYDIEFEAKLLLDSIYSESASLTKEQRDNFFEAISIDYESIPTKKERLRKIKTDPYYNALQVKFAYAITCHKAQGGEWMNIFVDIGYITEENLGISFYRWLYTAITRATNRLFFVNLPKEFIKNF